MAEAALGEGLGAEGTDAEEAGDDEASPDAESPAPVVGRAERFQVVVRVSAETLEEGAGGGPDVSAVTPRIADGPPLPRETARRIACDAALVPLTHDPTGGVLDVGRKRRTVPPALRRALDHRDRRCRFPGCGARFCDAHHLRHWADGGATRLDNLVLLCRHHHRRVHEDGWRVEWAETSRRARPAVRFVRLDGRGLPRVPPGPPVPRDAAAALREGQRGLGIDAWTAAPRGHGDRLDVDWALFTLPGGPQPRRPPDPAGDVSAETRARDGGRADRTGTGADGNGAKRSRSDGPGGRADGQEANGAGADGRD